MSTNSARNPLNSIHGSPSRPGRVSLPSGCWPLARSLAHATVLLLLLLYVDPAGRHCRHRRNSRRRVALHEHKASSQGKPRSRRTRGSPELFSIIALYTAVLMRLTYSIARLPLFIIHALLFFPSASRGISNPACRRPRAQREQGL